MKISEIIGSQCIRLLPVFPRDNGPKGKGYLFGGNLARDFERRYSFLQGPRLAQEFDVTKGINFFNGLFNFDGNDGTVERYSIDKCSIFNDGVVVEARLNTDIIDSFIDDALSWLKDVAGEAISNNTAVVRIYSSRIEVISDGNVESSLNKYTEFAAGISNTLSSYGQSYGTFSPTGIFFYTEFENKIPISRFSFERRDGKKFSSSTYYSVAPLSTPDHLNHLIQLENLLKE